jgi:pentatricopeptide repeat protein
LTEASYTILIQALAEAGASNEAVLCLDTMVEEGLTPNVISYAAAMAASRDKPNVVIELLDRMQAANVAPNTVVLTSAINSLAREGGEYTYKAYSILQDMETHGPDPNIYTYNTVTRAFAQAGKLGEALDLLKRIKSRHLKPDRFTFTTLLLCAGRHAALVDNSVSVNDKSQREVSSDTVSDIMTQMKIAGVVADEIAYGAAIDAHRRANNSLKAVECLHEMYKIGLEPAASHYNLVLRTMRAEGYIDKMYRMVVEICKKEGAKINGNTFELVIEALLGQGKWKEALSTLGLMEDMGFKPSLAVYVALVEQLEKAKQFRAVMALYRAMVRDGYGFCYSLVLPSFFSCLLCLCRSLSLDLLLPVCIL